MKQALSPTRKIAYAAMLIGVYVIASRLVGLAQPGPIFSFNRLGIGVATIIFASLFLGPVYGALVGIAGDALGWLLLGQWTGAFNIYISLFYGIIGVLPWLLQKVVGKLFGMRCSTIAFISVYTLVFSAFLLYFWISDAFDPSFVRWGLDVLWSKVFVTVLSAVLFALTMVSLFFLYRKKREGVEMGKIAWHCFAVEVVTIFLKPLAFYLYCLTFLGTNIETAWNVSYGTLVLLSFLFSFADIFINIVVLRLFAWVSDAVLPGAIS